MNTNQNIFSSKLESLWISNEFVALKLTNYKGDEAELKRLLIKPVELKKGLHLQFTFRYQTKDIVKNYEFEKAFDLIKNYLNFSAFRFAELSSISQLLSFQWFSESKSKLRTKQLSEKKEVNLKHDNKKKRMLDLKSSPFFQDLKLCDSKGNIFPKAQHKFKQINQFIEILNPYLSKLQRDTNLNVIDMGSGKGYLTFALAQFLHSNLNQKSTVCGIEFRKDMVELCQSIAQKHKMNQLQFVESKIEDFQPKDVDVLIALHACDTATDDAIKTGVEAEVDLLVLAPCCHKQVRRAMDDSCAVSELDYMSKHGILLERQAEMLTDVLRSEYLEYHGYKTKIMQFVDTEHTPKNLLLIAEKQTKSIEEQAKI
ncbi:MAG: class I SAM-dependent methyltransferase, partial [Flavobacteriales bacterium]